MCDAGLWKYVINIVAYIYVHWRGEGINFVKNCCTWNFISEVRDAPWIDIYCKTRFQMFFKLFVNKRVSLIRVSCSSQTYDAGLVALERLVGAVLWSTRRRASWEYCKGTRVSGSKSLYITVEKPSQDSQFVCNIWKKQSCMSLGWW